MEETTHDVTAAADDDVDADGTTADADGTTADADVEADAGPDLGRLHDGRVGRIVLSAMLAFLVYALVAWNIPASQLRDEVRPGVRPAVYMLGLYQSWSVFAPNPSTASVAVEADIHFADGDVVRHRFPHGDDLVGAYREYRWRKWERRVRLDRYDHLWRDAAEWLAARYEDDGTVERIVLIRRFSDTPEPGSDEERIWQSVEFYEYDVPEPSPDAEDDG